MESQVITSSSSICIICLSRHHVELNMLCDTCSHQLQVSRTVVESLAYILLSPAVTLHIHLCIRLLITIVCVLFLKIVTWCQCDSTFEWEEAIDDCIMRCQHSITQLLLMLLNSSYVRRCRLHDSCVRYTRTYWIDCPWWDQSKKLLSEPGVVCCSFTRNYYASAWCKSYVYFVHEHGYSQRIANKERARTGQMIFDFCESQGDGETYFTAQFVVLWWRHHHRLQEWDVKWAEINRLRHYLR